MSALKIKNFNDDECMKLITLNVPCEVAERAFRNRLAANEHYDVYDDDERNGLLWNHSTEFDNTMSFEIVFNRDDPHPSANYFSVLITCQRDGDDALDGTLQAPTELSVDQLYDVAAMMKKLMTLT